MPTMLSVLEEESENSEVFPPYVDANSIQPLPESPSKKASLKTFEEVQLLLQNGKKRDVKQIVRENAWPFDGGIRKKLWPVLCYQHAPNKNSIEEGYYWEMVKQLFGSSDLPERPLILPAFVEKAQCFAYHLTKRGRHITDRVVCILGYACPDITYSPAIYPITALLLHFMSEEDSYNCIASLVTSKEKVFVTQTKLLYEVTWRTVMQITKKHVKASAAHLARHCSSARAERIYMDWLWWVLQSLPFTHLVRVMDCFLHEGIKVFYRVAMAVILLFHKYSSSSSSKWAEEIQKSGIDLALAKFCEQIPVTPSKLLRTAFGIRALSSVYISKVFLRTEMLLKSRNVLNGSRQLSRSRSSDNLPTSQSQVNIQMMSHTLTIRELLVLWSWLPVRITMYQPVLLYTTEEHGCSLTTFYHRVEQHEPTLLMIKTAANEVFGAYCSTRWCERNMKDDKGNRQAYFGTGETFLFSLYPERAKYPWVGMQHGVGDAGLDHSAELFMAADSKMITIGGGGAQAIWMDENVRYGKTDRCLTFNNPPLCAGRDFEIRVLEVYGFSCA
ncbi:UNVERIFIED_CONTAM: hypothetical protein PYX00_006616 [Menopon gallinae]|uniref:TBC1 domain family member 24 n=1 Tax=Menopon gallinae TaxID=328185 RepID=A0AAW2HWG2_9NEOP